jgi:OOP family OmpA-OmpF porin
VQQVFMTLLGSSCIALSLYAQAPLPSGEFPLIQPVSVEEAPLLESAPKPQEEPRVEALQEPAQQSTQEQAPQEQDGDKDGVQDSQDLCPNTQEGVKVDANGCELDSDGDGVVDSKDKCPNTTKDFMVDGYGCPQTATLKVTFESGAYKLTDTIIKEVEEFALFLKNNKGYQVVIVGYTDNKGNAKQNKALSQKRADSVKKALLRYGIKETRLTAVGRGIENPVADNATAEGRAANRRIEVELIQ